MLLQNDDPSKISELESDIRACLSYGFKLLTFPFELEKRFQEYDTDKRRHRYVFMGICAIVLYDLYSLGDKIMVPDIYPIAWKLRFFFITPVMAIAIMLINFKIFERYQDYLADLLMVLTTSGVIYILLLSSHKNVVQYQTGLLVIIMYGNIAARIRFNHALGASIFVFILYLYFTHFIEHMTPELINNSGLIMLTTIILSLLANYQMEKETRKEYLLTLLQIINTEKLKEQNQQLEQLSISDSLTGLSNRRFFDETLEIEWKAAKRSGYEVSLIFIDIDCFKPYNDNYGHHAGDLCLREIGSVIQESIKRPRDLAARYGGEEFVILLPKTDQADAVRLAEKIRREIEWLEIVHQYSNVSKNVTVSIGVANVIPSQGLQVEELLKSADSGMYKAKMQGRNRVSVYSDECVM